MSYDVAKIERQISGFLDDIHVATYNLVDIIGDKQEEIVALERA